MIVPFIDRLRDTIHMVAFDKRNTNYTLMQFTENRGGNAGKRYNYAIDFPPSYHEDICNIICLFRVKRKHLPSFITRFKYYWSFYKR